MYSFSNKYKTLLIKFCRSSSIINSEDKKVSNFIFDVYFDRKCENVASNNSTHIAF